MLIIKRLKFIDSLYLLCGNYFKQSYDNLFFYFCSTSKLLYTIKKSNCDKSHYNDCIIINGTKEFIEKAREEIENNLLENKTIEVIDCYDIEDCKYGIKDILDKHEKILNTSGEKDKEEYITTIKVAN